MAILRPLNEPGYSGHCGYGGLIPPALWISMAQKARCCGRRAARPVAVPGKLFPWHGCVAQFAAKLCRNEQAARAGQEDNLALWHGPDDLAHAAKRVNKLGMSGRAGRAFGMRSRRQQDPSLPWYQCATVRWPSRAGSMRAGRTLEIC